MSSFLVPSFKTAAFAALFTIAAATIATAHLTYSGRDFGPLVIGDPAVTIASQTVSSAFGWADATDADWGDSHRGRAFRFTLTDTTTVVISVARNSLGTGAADTLLPAFSLYLGLGTMSPEQPGHDSSELSLASRPAGTEGSLRTLADWSLGNDPTYVTAGDPLSGVLYAARLAEFTYVGHAADGTAANYGLVDGISGDGLADGFVTGTFTDLVAGDYTIYVGGADHAAQLVETGPTYPTYGISVSVQAVPEPATWALGLGGAALALALWRRRRATPHAGAA